MEIEVLEKTTIFQGRVFDVRQERVRLPDGTDHSVDMVIHGGSVAIVPMGEQGLLWFVEQYRHPAGKSLLEFPAGVVDPGETHAECAQRELREEIGMAASELTRLGEFYLAPGYSSELLHVYLASRLYHAPLEGDEDENVRVVQIPVQKAFQLAENGEILDAKTLGALTLARKRILP